MRFVNHTDPILFRCFLNETQAIKTLDRWMKTENKSENDKNPIGWNELSRHFSCNLFSIWGAHATHESNWTMIIFIFKFTRPLPPEFPPFQQKFCVGIVVVVVHSSHGAHFCFHFIKFWFYSYFAVFICGLIDSVFSVYFFVLFFDWPTMSENKQEKKKKNIRQKCRQKNVKWIRKKYK